MCQDRQRYTEKPCLKKKKKKKKHEVEIPNHLNIVQIGFTNS